jgi:hypothetical protein
MVGSSGVTLAHTALMLGDAISMPTSPARAVRSRSG